MSHIAFVPFQSSFRGLRRANAPDPTLAGSYGPRALEKNPSMILILPLRRYYALRLGLAPHQVCAFRGRWVVVSSWKRGVRDTRLLFCLKAGIQ